MSCRQRLLTLRPSSQAQVRSSACTDGVRLIVTRLLCEGSSDGGWLMRSVPAAVGVGVLHQLYSNLCGRSS